MAWFVGGPWGARRQEPGVCPAESWRGEGEWGGFSLSEGCVELSRHRSASTVSLPPQLPGTELRPGRGVYRALGLRASNPLRGLHASQHRVLRGPSPGGEHFLSCCSFGCPVSLLPGGGAGVACVCGTGPVALALCPPTSPAVKEQPPFGGWCASPASQREKAPPPCLAPSLQ